MKKVGKLNFLIGIVASILIVVQGVIGIIMYANGSDTPDMSKMEMPAASTSTDSSTTTTEDSTTDSDNTANQDSTTATPPNGGQGQGTMGGTPPQGGPNGSAGGPSGMPTGGGFPGEDSFSNKVIDFYQGVGGLATSVIVLVIGGVGLVTSVMSRKSA